MQFLFTSRHFKAREDLRELAERESEKLIKYYDGIIKCEVVLNEEKRDGNLKTCEVIIRTNINHTFTGKECTNDYNISIRKAFSEVKSQIKKFKEKLKSSHAYRPTKQI